MENIASKTNKYCKKNLKNSPSNLLPSLKSPFIPDLSVEADQDICGI